MITFPEPTAAEISAEHARAGGGPAAARARLLSAAETATRRFSEALPGVLEDISAKDRLAAEAAAEAAESRAAAQAAFDAAASGVMEIGAVYARIKIVEGLQLTPVTEAELAENALENFLVLQGPGASEAVMSGFTVGWQELAMRHFLGKHVPAFVAGLKLRAESLILSLADHCRENKIDLAAVLKIIAEESSGRHNVPARFPDYGRINHLGGFEAVQTLASELATNFPAI